ncbi:hypothetical protein KQI86_01580 [Clostridium sp. MSJ-11]|uniref:Uncharacterized protein n=1 Tax=Clostridium mobile TaxID=2841512 RepID=A0ABS6ECY7_9CLOT|nr:hypothetical protein [Clostridium mobile]MBU5482997.1 hypothetical protein [Clostridium mobile]
MIEELQRIKFYNELIKIIFGIIYYENKKKGKIFMPKDSQPDNKKARMEKSNYQTPITRETAKNSNRTTKKQSAERGQ